MQHLKNFVENKGLSLDSLLEEVEASYGGVLCVIATGSIAAGFGNCNSDVDLMIMVDQDSVSPMPIMSYKNGLKIDSEYYYGDKLAQQIESVLQEVYPPQGQLRPLDWPKYFRAIQIATRFSVSQPLRGNQKWMDLIQRCKSPAMYSQVSQWWLLEALRGLAGARMVAQHNSKYAAFVYTDAVMALLSARVAKQGLVLLSKKWLGEKLNRLEDADNLALYRRVLTASCDHMGEAHTLCDDLDTVLSNAEELQGLIKTSHYDVWLSKHTEIKRFDDLTILKKYFRGCKVKAEHHQKNAISNNMPLACYDFSAKVDEEIQQMFLQGFAWVGLTLTA